LFTESQNQIITSLPGRTVVYAAPGSGKTTVLTHHIADQLQNHRFRPNGIMAITFTRQSAIDMKKRMIKLNGMSRKTIEALQIGTFHAQLFQFLLKSTSDIPVLLSTTEQYEIMKLSIESCYGYRMHVTRSEVQQLLNTYSVNQATYPPTFLHKRDRRIINTYIRRKRALNRWDFDDIMQAFCNRLEDGPNTSIMKELSRIQYLLVDEYQDTNSIQWTILQQLVAELQIPIFVVGDDDQSIYGFRGASPQFLLSFKTTYPDANQYTLDENFRSSPIIVEHAYNLIENNRIRTAKQMKPARNSKGLIKSYQVANEDTEAKCAVAALIKIKENHPEWSCAVLSRTRRQLYKVWCRIQNTGLKGTELRTFHDAKGREWDAIMIVGLVAQNPYLAKHVANSQEMEEERRLYYVALTRARYVSCTFIPQQIAGRPALPSPFVAEAKIPIVQS
jgi:DNA helicase II / ATP-dependent DNA helicase PcrA